MLKKIRMTDFNKILDKAKEIEEKIKDSQEKIKQIKVEGSSGGGLVKVILNGNSEIEKIDNTIFSIFFSKFSTLLDKTSNSSLLVSFILKTISSLLDFSIFNISEPRSFDVIRPCSKIFDNLSKTNFEFFIFLF